MEHFIAVKKRELPISATTWLNNRHNVERKKLDTKECTLYDSIYMKLKRQFICDNKDQNSIYHCRGMPLAGQGH